MPHGTCYMWNTPLLLLHVGSNAFIGLSYFCLSACLFYIFKKRKDFPFPKLFIVYVLFILLCGAGHFFDIYTIWKPYYFIAGYLRLAIATVSILAAFIMLKSLSSILSMPNLKILQSKIEDEKFEILAELKTAVLVLDHQFKVIYFNNVCGQLFPEGSMRLNESFFSFFTEEDLVEPKKIAALTSKGPWQKILKVEKTKDQILDLEVNITQVGKNSEKKQYIVGCNDLSNVLRQQREKGKLDKLLEVTNREVPHLLSYVDKDLRYQFVNRRYETYFDKRADQLIGEKVESILPAETFRQSLDSFKRVLQGETVRTELKNRMLNRPLDYFDVYYSPDIDSNGEVQGFVVLAVDITAIVKVRHQLARKNEFLEQYAYLVSHDLRAPLRHISNYTELLAQELSDLPSENSKKYLNYIDKNSKRAHSMISGMLKLSTVVKDSASRSKLGLGRYLQEKLNGIFLEDQVTLKIDDPLETTVSIDEDTFYLVFQNLIENSIKYKSDDKPEVCIDIEKSYNKVLINYRDNSSGIDEEDHELIFKAFWKKDKQTDGPGLGMMIVRKVLENHQGEIRSLTSSEGCHFQITLEV